MWKNVLSAGDVASAGNAKIENDTDIDLTSEQKSASLYNSVSSMKSNSDVWI